jgi:uncharacterized protein
MRQLALASLLVALFAYAPGAHAYTSPGSPAGYVNDFAHVLSPTTVSTLETELTAFAASTTNEITVVTVPSMGGDYVENYAVKLFAEWGIGKKDKDNGVLLLLAIADRKMRIEVGYGLEGALPDSVAQSILNQEMTPLLKKGDYDGAVTAGVRAIEAATRGEYSAPSGGFSAEGIFSEVVLGHLFFLVLIVIQVFSAVLARSKSWYAGGILGGIGGFAAGLLLLKSLFLAISGALLLGAIGALFDYVVSKGYQSAKARGVKPPWWAGGSMGSGSGGGGGFGGFGGGSSGGGGASGSW